MSNSLTMALGLLLPLGTCMAQEAIRSPGPTVQLEAVLATGDELPRTGTVQRITSLDVNRDELALRVEAWAPGTDNNREVILTGWHRGPFVPALIGGDVFERDRRFTTARTGIESVQLSASRILAYRTPLVAGGVSRMAIVGEAMNLYDVRVFGLVGDQVPSFARGVLWASFGAYQQGEGAFACLGAVAGPGISAANDQVLMKLGTGWDLEFLQEGRSFSTLDGDSLGFAATSVPTVRAPIITWVGPTTTFRGETRAAVVAASPVRYIAKQGNPAPGLPGVTFQEFHPYPSIDVRGIEIAYTAALTGAGVTASNRMSIWTGSGALLARGDQRAPGTPEGIRYATFSAPVLYGPGGSVLFTAILQGVAGDQGRTGLFAGPPGAIRLIARDGDPAPGAAEGAAFGSFSPLTDADPIFVNETGTIVFLSRLRGPGVTADNDVAIFAWDPDEGLALIAREGQTVPFRGGVRTISTLAFNSPEGPGALQTNGLDGRRTILNRHGECFFIATFGDAGQQALMKAQVTHPPCIADFNADRFIDCFDYLDFVGAFEQGDPDADINEDGFLDFFDYGTFVEWFEAGC